VEELVKEREDLQRAASALEQLIENQKQVLVELEQQVDAAQRRAEKATEDAAVKMEAARGKEAELDSLQTRLRTVLGVFGIERSFRKLSQSVGTLREALMPPPLVIAGPSAVGKASLISMLFREFPHTFGIPIRHVPARSHSPPCSMGVELTTKR